MITAKLIAHSVSAVTNKEMYTYELEFPRIILAEMNTHRLTSKNCASTRAIPLNRQIALMDHNKFIPSYWGKKQSGMSAKEQLDKESIGKCLEVFEDTYKVIRESILELDDIGLHKQTAGRLGEPFMYVKAVVSGTEFDNFFWLRKDPDAQPEIQELASKMWEAKKNSVPVMLYPEEWHMPYYGDGYWTPRSEDSLEDALKISTSCAGQVSYRKLDTSVEKAEDIYGKLVNGRKVHASPFEHQATPMPKFANFDTSPYITSHHRELGYMSGNLAGWIQHRQMIPNNVCWDYQE